jgi:hypothetical protein
MADRSTAVRAPRSEADFQKWYQSIAKVYHLAPNPDDPLHFYDYRAAFNAGVTGPGPQGHWPSLYKREAHPNRFVAGEDTLMGIPAAPFLRRVGQ